jgi:hypothetical protein
MELRAKGPMNRYSVAPVCIVALFTTLLTGCGAGFAPQLSGAGPITGPALRGVTYGGQQPIAGGRVYLFGFGQNCSTGCTNGQTVSLLTSAVLTNSPGYSGYDGTNYYIVTDSNGNFSITGDYSCYPGQAVYAYGPGGNTGHGTNAAIGLLASLGTCPNADNFASTIPFLWMNEESTILTAYALAGFGTSPSALSSGSSANAMLAAANAAATVPLLFNYATGQAVSSFTVSGGNGVTATVPQTKINTLADILADCISSSGSTSTECTRLFTDTGVSSTSDTAAIALAMAHMQGAPSATISDLFNNVLSPTPPFQPTLMSAPNDLAIPIVYSKAAWTSAPAGSMAFDDGGKLWTFVTGDTNSATGMDLFSLNPATGTTATAVPTVGSSVTPVYTSIVVSPTDNTVWAGDTANNSVDQFSSGAYNTSIPLNGASSTTNISLVFSGPYSGFSTHGGDLIANSYDSGTNTATISDPINSNDITFNQTESNPNSPQYQTISGSGSSLSIAMDSKLNLWIPGAGGGFFGTNSWEVPTYPITPGGDRYNSIQGAQPGSTFVLAYGTGVLLLSGTSLYSPGTGFGHFSALECTLSGPAGTPNNAVLDSAGAIWAGDPSNNGITGPEYIYGTGTLSAGVCSGTNLAPNGLDNGSSGLAPIFVAADSSGNLWSLNGYTTASTATKVTFTEFLGLTAPLATPSTSANIASAP